MSQDKTAQEQPRRTYHAPQFEDYGKVSQLTQANYGNGGDGGQTNNYTASAV